MFQSGKWKKSWRKGCLEECATIAYVLSWTYSLPPKNKKICKSASHNYGKEELGVGFYSSTFLSSSSFLYLVSNYYLQCGLLFCCPHSSVESFNHCGWSLPGAKYDSVLPNIITFRYFLYLFYGHWHRDLSVTFGFWPLMILEGGNLWLSCLPMQASLATTGENKANKQRDTKANEPWKTNSPKTFLSTWIQPYLKLVFPFVHPTVWLDKITSFCFT